MHSIWNWIIFGTRKLRINTRVWWFFVLYIYILHNSSVCTYRFLTVQINSLIRCNFEYHKQLVTCNVVFLKSCSTKMWWKRVNCEYHGNQIMHIKQLQEPLQINHKIIVRAYKCNMYNSCNNIMILKNEECLKLLSFFLR